jgi:hypothetical protein
MRQRAGAGCLLFHPCDVRLKPVDHDGAVSYTPEPGRNAEKRQREYAAFVAAIDNLRTRIRRMRQEKLGYREGVLVRGSYGFPDAFGCVIEDTGPDVRVALWQKGFTIPVTVPREQVERVDLTEYGPPPGKDGRK